MKIALVFGCVVVAAGVFFLMTTHAQDAIIEEIVVTATKRDTTVMDECLEEHHAAEFSLREMVKFYNRDLEALHRLALFIYTIQTTSLRKENQAMRSVEERNMERVKHWEWTWNK